MSDIPTVIQQLADKIGTTAEKAWPLYVDFIRVDAMSTIIISAVLWVIFAVTLLATVMIRKRNAEDSEFYGPVAFMAAILLTVSTIIGGTESAKAIPRLMAPEGAAIHDVIGKIDP